MKTKRTQMSREKQLKACERIRRKTTQKFKDVQLGSLRNEPQSDERLNVEELTQNLYKVESLNLTIHSKSQSKSHKNHNLNNKNFKFQKRNGKNQNVHNKKFKKISLCHICKMTVL